MAQHSIYSSHTSFEPCNCQNKLNQKIQEGKHGAAKQRFLKQHKQSSRLIRILARHARQKGARVQDIAKILNLSTRTAWKWTMDLDISFKGKNRAKKYTWTSKQVGYRILVKLVATVQRLLHKIPMREINIARLLDEH